jgi:hypothetical protein
MLHHRVERLLLSGQDTVPGTTRAGPRPRAGLPLPRPVPRDPRPARVGVALRGLTASGLRRLVRGPRRSHGRTDQGPRGTHGYTDPESYLELEFAVGFAAEEELLK